VVFSWLFEQPKVRAVMHDERSKTYNFLKKSSEFFLTRYYLKLASSRLIYRLYCLLNPDRRFLNRFNLDVLHVPRQHSPAYNLKYPVIITMHDVQHFHFPEFFSPVERIYKSIRYFTSMSETTHVIVSYSHVKNDLNKYFSNIKARISVCPVPLNEDWTAGYPETSINDLKETYNTPDHIILTPAATWEHKNHIAVLKALSLLRDEGLKIFWVSTGNKTGFYPTIEKSINELNLADQVLFTGVVPESDLIGFYKIAKLVVIPTLYEAGSGPLIEAIRYNTPVICSNVTSLPETIGNSEFVFDPTNYRQIADLIKRALTDDKFLTRNKANSEKRAFFYNNVSSSAAFIEAYNIAITDFIADKK